MHITKKQAAVMIFLTLCIAALVCVILFLQGKLFSTPAPDDPTVPGGDDSGTTGVDPETPTPPPHVKLRPASDGAVKEISRETRLMGSGDETIVFSHTLGGVTYIFGNATVRGYDFDGSGGFLCRLASDGRIVGFTYFDGRITAAAIVEGGFGVATVNGERAALNIVNSDGESRFASELDGEAVDILAGGSSRLAVVTMPSANTVKLTEYATAGGAYAVGNSTRISGGLDITYFDCYIMGDGYIISARASSLPRYDALVFYTFKAGGDAVPHYYGGEGDGMLTPYAVVPYGGGFMAAASRGGEAAVVSLDYSFTSYRRDMLGQSCTSASLIHASGKYYMTVTGDEGTTTMEIDDSLNRRTVTGLAGTPCGAAVTDDGVAYVCVTPDSLTVTDLADINVTLAVREAIVARVVKIGYNELLITLSARGGAALSAPTAERDVYAIAVLL